jgi:hypothetical protein
MLFFWGSMRAVVFALICAAALPGSSAFLSAGHDASLLCSAQFALKPQVAVSLRSARRPGVLSLQVSKCAPLLVDWACFANQVFYHVSPFHSVTMHEISFCYYA